MKRIFWKTRGAVRLMADAIRAHDARLTYSQDGEDIMIQSLFQNVESGFYVDVGCYHPVRYSNTFMFHKKGWRGINIDATPGVKALFDRYRPSDINIWSAISSMKGEVEFATFGEGAVNTLADREVPVAFGSPNMIRVQSMTLADTLAKYLPPGQDIDFLSVDVEGVDLEVLRSNDWKCFRPKVVCVEQVGINLRKMLDGPMCRFMEDMGYVLYARTPLSMIFKEQQFFPPYVDRSLA